MKRVLNLKNRVAVISVFAVLLLTATSFSFGPADDARLVDNQPQKKVHRIKVIVNKDGKETKIDTTFNLNDEKMVQAKVDSVLRKLDIEGIGSEKSDMVIHRNGKRMICTLKGGENKPGEEQFDIIIQNGDSGKMNKMKKIIRLDGRGNRLNNIEAFGDMVPPPPPIPPGAAVMFHKRLSGDPYAFDTKDESVVSYEKKDIGNGLERITIIRKKHEEPQHKKEMKVKAEISTETKK